MRVTISGVILNASDLPPATVDSARVVAGWVKEWASEHDWQVADVSCRFDAVETHHPESGEPHQFHDGEPCFPGCPAWDGKR